MKNLVFMRPLYWCDFYCTYNLLFKLNCKLLRIYANAKIQHNQPFLLGLVHQVRDTFEQPRDFTYDQPNVVQSHSTQWHHNHPQSQSRNTWQLNIIYLNQLISSKKIKYLTNYVKLNKFHKLLDTEQFFSPLKSSQQIKQLSSK